MRRREEVVAVEAAHQGQLVEGRNDVPLVSRCHLHTLHATDVGELLGHHAVHLDGLGIDRNLR